MALVPVITISVDLSGSGFVAESYDPAACARGATATVALVKLMTLLREQYERENPRSNVIPFPGARHGAIV